MKKTLILTLLVAGIASCLILSGCNNDHEETQAFISSSALNGAYTQAVPHFDAAKEEAEKKAATHAGGTNVTGANQGQTTPPKGLPEVIETRSTDDGDLLVLVNKKYTVSRDYAPTDMVAIDGSLSTNQGIYVKRVALDAYLNMLNDAKAEGLSFKICSTYRSYDLQKRLYNNNLSQHGETYTNLRSAYPGRSEHHTGLAIDVTSASMGYGLSQNFINYPEGLWINNHCSEYGFIVRYPNGKTDITGYDYEPWHLRYVGVETAKEITSRGITLEEYLGKV